MNDTPPPPQTEEFDETDSAQESEVTHEENIGCLSATGGCLLACFQFLGHCILVGCGFQLFIGTLLRFTIRDAAPYLAVFFYVSPPILLTISAFVLFLRKFILRQKRWAISYLSIIMLTMGWWWIGFYQWPIAEQATSSSQSHQFLFWNVRYARAGWPAIVKELKTHDADVIGLVEVGNGFHARKEGLEAGFPDRHILFLGNGFLIVRGEIISHEQGSLERHGAYGRTHIRLQDGSECDVILIDIYAFPFMPRGPAFAALKKLMQESSARPVCLMGDFNTPPDSIFFDSIRNKLAHAFEERGEGFNVTWPVPAPVLCLDQIWLPKDKISAARYHSSPHSDHRLVVVEAAHLNGPLPNSSAENENLLKN